MKKHNKIKAGVVGYPISHSLSPIIHNHWLEKLDINGSYELIEIKPDNFEKDLKKLVDSGFKGFNITIPFKDKAFSLVDELSDTAIKIGAVNTIIVNDDNTLKGHNTDAFGFIENIKQSAKNFSLNNKTAMVLGAGGASKAIIYGLLDENVSKIYLTNRTLERAQKQAQDKVEIIQWEKKEEVLDNVDILVNTTSLGMRGQNPLQISLDNLNQNALVSDIVYNPLETDLLKLANQNGNQTINGLGMLIYQAKEGFENWFGQKPTVDDFLKEKLITYTITPVNK